MIDAERGHCRFAEAPHTPPARTAFPRASADDAAMRELLDGYLFTYDMAAISCALALTAACCRSYSAATPTTFRPATFSNADYAQPPGRTLRATKRRRAARRHAGHDYCATFRRRSLARAALTIVRAPAGHQQASGGHHCRRRQRPGTARA